MTSGTESPRARPVVAVLDVGSTAKTGWCRVDADGSDSGGRDVDQLAELLAQDLIQGESVALGLECPLWIPMPASVAEVGKGRRGEGSPAWSSTTGATVMTYGLQQSSYLLARLHRLAPGPFRVSFNPEVLAVGGAGLLVWEAFVSGKAKDLTAAEPHISDARAAVTEFCRRWDAGVVHSDLESGSVISIAGLAVHAAGLSVEARLLHEAPVVVKAPPLG